MGNKTRQFNLARERMKEEAANAERGKLRKNPMSTDLKLTGRLGAVFEEMKAADANGRWLTVPELAGRVQLRMGKLISETGLSARIRDLRKEKHGGHTVDKRQRGGRGNLWEFRLRVHARGLFE